MRGKLNTPLILSSEDIHLWFVDCEYVQDKCLIDKYISFMSTQEAKKYRAFYFDKDRKQYLITRALIRTVLSMYVPNISPEDWEFIQNDYGKPQVCPTLLPFPLTFNLSHTTSMIVLAVTSCYDIGVDVEAFDSNVAMADLAKHSFSPLENQQMINFEPDAFRQRFFDLWTLKEAYIKACGMGLSIPLDSFSFSFPEESRISISFAPSRSDDPKLWKFWQLKLGERYNVSLAIKTDSVILKNKLLMRYITPLDGYSELSIPVLKHSL